MYGYPPAVNPVEADELRVIFREAISDRGVRRRMSCHTDVCAWKKFRETARSQADTRNAAAVQRSHIRETP